MEKVFKAKRHKKHLFKIRYLIFIGIIYLSFDTTYGFLLDKKTSIETDEYLKLILSDTNHNFVTDYKPKKILSRVITAFSNIDITKPTSLLSFNIKNDTAIPTGNTTGSHSDNYDLDKQEKITDYIKDPNPVEISKPRIYIYNSHQLENYNTKNLEIYNITPNVMMASYMLKEKLNDLGVGTVVNEFNLAEFIRINNWDHGDSYKASRIFILDAKSKYGTLEYYIDIHRDSIKKNDSTKKINGKDYARTLFVVGLENANYAANLELANKLNEMINKSYPGLSRGVIKKQGAGVDGVYNQDISPKSMLIEVGGYENTIEEVMCTIEALSKVLYEYIGDAS
jgi:stage II sporulation protein P